MMDHHTPGTIGRLLTEARSAVARLDLGSWLDRQPEAWLGGIRVVAADLAAS